MCGFLKFCDASSEAPTRDVGCVVRPNLEEALLLSLRAIITFALTGSILQACGPASPMPRVPNSELSRSPSETPGTEDATSRGGADPTDETEEELTLPSDDESALAQLLRDCGDIDPETPDKILVEQSLTAVPFVQSGTRPILGGLIPIYYSIEIGGTLALNGTISRSVSTTTLVLRSAQPALARRTAEQELVRNNATVTTTLLPYEERS